MFTANDLTLLITTLNFAAAKHRDQRRKDREASPYINHPIQVAEILWRVGEVRDIMTILGALLHDTLEDTNATPAEISELCGDEIVALVQEVSDDKSLPKATRKCLQVEHAPFLSLRAKQIKIADKICNVYDIAHSPPRYWSVKRCREYLDWSEQVVNGLRGANPALEAYYDTVLSEARQLFAGAP